MTGTSNQIGNFQYHNFSDDRGNSYYGNSTRIGNTTFHNLYGNGSTLNGTTNRIGSGSFSTSDEAWDWTASDWYSNRCDFPVFSLGIRAG